MDAYKVKHVTQLARRLSEDELTQVIETLTLSLHKRRRLNRPTAHADHKWHTRQ